MADARTGSVFTDAITDLLLPALGIRLFMKRSEGGHSDPTASSQDEFALLHALETLEGEDAKMKEFILGYLRYLKSENKSRIIPRLRETIARAGGKDGAKAEEVQKLLVSIFKEEFAKLADAAGDQSTTAAYRKISDDLDIILTQRLMATLRDRWGQFTDFFADLEQQHVEAADDLDEFFRSRRERRRNRNQGRS